MGLETTAEVDAIESVADRNGDQRPPANADEQGVTNARLGNHGSGADGEVTDDTTGSTLSSGAVPHGIEVVVQAKYDNASRVKVGLSASPTVELQAGQSITYRVQDRSQVHVEAKSDGDGVNWTHEVSA